MKSKNVNTRKTTQEFISDAIKVHGHLYNYDKVIYLRNKSKVEIICNKHMSFFQSPKAHLNGQGCPKCGREKLSKLNKYTTEEILEIFRKKHGNKFIYDKLDYINFNEKITVGCPKHGYYLTTPHSHSLYGCKKCYYEIIGKSLIKPVEFFIKKASEIHLNFYDYTNIKYVNSSSKIEIYCPKHGVFSQIAKKHLSGQGCPTCNKSKGELEITRYLQKNLINYISQHYFNDCRNKNPLPFDFYLPDYNICIEFDGHQHKAKSKKDSYFYNEKTKINDEIKNEYCKHNNILLLRLTSLLSIDTNLTKYFKKLNIISNEEKKKNFIKKAVELWGYKYDYSRVDYINSQTPVSIGYKGIWFKQTPSKHLQGKKIECQESKMSNDNFILKSKQVWGDQRFDYSKCEYLGTNRKIKLYDNEKCKWIEQVAKSHLNGFEVTKIDKNEFLDICNINHEFKYTYKLENYKSLISQIDINCKLHGDFKMKAASHIYGGCCPKCDDSIFNRETQKILKKYNINFDRQKKFTDCRNKFELPFDFYIPSMRTCIEFDGKQHFQPMDFFGGLKAFENLKLNDKIKSDYCEDNYIELIRIRWDQIDDIHQILWDNLKNKIKILRKK